LVTTLPEDRPADAADFRACAAGADATLVIAPEFDDLLFERSQWVLQAGGRLLSALPEAVRLCGDKLAMYRHWQAAGLPSPTTVAASPSPPIAFGPPWVCKPRHGAGSQATALIHDAAAWPAAFAAAAAQWELVAQPYVAGLPVSVSFLLGPGSCLALPP